MQNDSTNRKPEIVAHFTSMSSTIKHASDILKLAVKHTELSNVLAACSGVLTATALEQGLIFLLSGASFEWSDINEGITVPNPFEELKLQSLRSRMIRTPELLSEGRLELKRDSPYTRALHDLITLRNDLMHIHDEPESLSDRDPRIRIEHAEDGAPTIFLNGDLLLVDRWNLVTKEEAQRFLDAINIYFDELMDEPRRRGNDELQPGKLLVKREGR